VKTTQEKEKRGPKEAEIYILLGGGQSQSDSKNGKKTLVNRRPNGIDRAQNSLKRKQIFISSCRQCTRPLTKFIKGGKSKVIKKKR